MGCKNSSRVNDGKFSNRDLHKILSVTCEAPFQFTKEDHENIVNVWKLTKEKGLDLEVFINMFRTILAAYPQTIHKLPIGLSKKRFAYDWKWYLDSMFVEFTKKHIKWMDDFIDAIGEGENETSFFIDRFCLQHESIIENQNTFILKIGLESIHEFLFYTIPGYGNSKMSQSWVNMLKVIYNGVVTTKGERSPDAFCFKRPGIIPHRQSRYFNLLDRPISPGVWASTDVAAVQSVWRELFQSGEGRVSLVFIQQLSCLYPCCCTVIMGRRSDAEIIPIYDDDKAKSWVLKLLSWFDSLFENIDDKEFCVKHIATFRDTMGMELSFFKAALHTLVMAFVQLLTQEDLSSQIWSDRETEWFNGIHYLYSLIPAIPA